MRCAALGDHAAEQAVRPWRAEQSGDAEATRRLAGDGDLARVAAEAFDVVAHPLERGNLVENAVDARVRELRAKALEVRESQRAEAVVDGYRHDVAVGGETRAVVPRYGALAVAVAAAVDPHQYGTPAVVQGRCLHLQRQAVLVPADRGRIGHATACDLRRGGAELAGVAHTRPGLKGLRGPEPAWTDWRCGVRNAGEQQDILLRATLHSP